MNKDNARLTIINESDAFGEERLELITDGAYFQKNGTTYIMYDENKEMGMPNCSVTIKYDGKDVLITRKGDFSSRMYYRPGKATEFLYQMPYGSIPVIIYTKKVNASLDSNGGSLNLYYTVNMQNSDFEYSLEVSVERKTENTYGGLSV